MPNEVFAYLTGFICLIVWLIFSFVTKQPTGRKILVSLCIVYLAAVASITLFPVVLYQDIISGYEYDCERIILVPFKTISTMLRAGLKTTIIQIIGNIVMTVPYGAAIPFFMKNKKRYNYIIAGLAFPVSIELLQLILGLVTQTMYRTVDIDDVILNFTGVIIGYGIYKILPKSVKEFFGKTKQKNA